MMILFRLPMYATKRNDPTADGLSGLSCYFHYGQLAPQRAVLEVNKHKSKHTASVGQYRLSRLGLLICKSFSLHGPVHLHLESFVEELVVRRGN